MVIAKESINLLSNSSEPDLGQAARRGFLPRRAVLGKVRLARRVGHDRQTVEGVAWQRDWTKTIRTSTSIAGTSKPTSRLGKINRFACGRQRRGRRIMSTPVAHDPQFNGNCLPLWAGELSGVRML